MNRNSLQAIPSPGNNQNFTQQALESADWVSGASSVSNLFFFCFCFFLSTLAWEWVWFLFDFLTTIKILLLA